MDYKYLVFTWVLGDEEEPFKTGNYCTASDEDTLIDFLSTYGVRFMESKKRKGLIPKIDLYEVIDGNKVKIYESFNWNESRNVEDLFEKSKEVGDGDEQLDVFFVFMNEMKRRTGKIEYKAILVKDKVEDGRLVRDILGVYNPENRAEVLKLISGPVGFVALGERLETAVYEKAEITEMYLYEWAESEPDVCMEYKTIISNKNGEDIGDFFKYREEKNVESTLLTFRDHLKEFEKPCPDGSTLDVLKEWGL